MQFLFSGSDASRSGKQKGQDEKSDERAIIVAGKSGLLWSGDDFSDK